MTNIQLPDSFIKGLICKVHVSLNGKNATKELKVCAVKARSITFIEVDRKIVKTFSERWTVKIL